MKKFAFLLVAATSLASCSSDEPMIKQEDNQVNNLHPYKEIIERANYYYSQLPGKTRAATPSVSNLEMIGYNATRSENETPTYCLVNYENEAGFVIVGANEVADPMVAVSDEGNLNLADTTYFKPLAAFINGLADPDLPIDTITPLDPLPENISVDPKLSKGVSRWGQREPFNSALPYLTSGRKASVGCSALAVAMYMSYHETPDSYGGRNLNWKMMKIWPESSDLAYFLYILGDENNLNLTYQETGSGTFPLEYVYERTFTNCGYLYSSPSPLSNFNFSSKFMVNMQLPMILRGDPGEGNSLGGHVWITDGLLHLQDRDMFNSKEIIDTFYLHCVWGWYGRGNGYFKFDKLNRIGGNREGGNDTGTYSGYNDIDEVPEFCRAYGLWGIRPGGQIIKPDLGL